MEKQQSHTSRSGCFASRQPNNVSTRGHSQSDSPSYWLSTCSMSKVDNVQSQAQSEAFIPNPSRQSEHAPTNVDVLKQPPPESSRTRWTRRSIIFSFWAIAVLLGFPTWWWTTNVYRAGLPLQSMSDWADGKVRQLPLFILVSY